MLGYEGELCDAISRCIHPLLDKKQVNFSLAAKYFALSASSVKSVTKKHLERIGVEGILDR